MGKPFLGLPEQITRLFVVFAVLIGGVIIVRQFVVPSNLKETGFQMVSAIEREVSKEVKYAGSLICMDCHDDIYDMKKGGHHGDLSCETCHGPAMIHTEDPTEVKPETPTQRKHCSMCHKYDLSRPTGFPQINTVLHNPLKPCMTCHNPHNPEPPESPRGCAACHAEISRTKAVSYHALLECTTCHEATEGHNITPRKVKPTKPMEREFCGRCHGLSSSSKEALKVDLDTHEEKYVCWQCHYPHMPEGG